MRCPSCYATNPDTAAFCGQCFTRFTTDDPAETPAPPLPKRVTGTDLVDPSPPAERAVEAGRFHAGAAGVAWTCAVCGEENDVDVFACVVCGTRMDFEEADPAATNVDWPAARRVELLAPGVGHLRVGSTGLGAARAGMVVLWLIGAAALATGGAPGLLTALPLLIGVVAIWATGPRDLDAHRTGREPLLDPRRFMYLVIGVTMGVIVLGGLGLVL